MNLHIDWTACDGRGVCTELLEEMLTEDDWGYPIARNGTAVPPSLEGAAKRAVDRCPMLALRLTADRARASS
jgi:ferredoxin